MDYILAELSASITELKKNPTALIKQAGTRPIAILNHNRPSAYLVPARAFEVLMDLLEDVAFTQPARSAAISSPTNRDFSRASISGLRRSCRS